MDGGQGGLGRSHLIGTEVCHLEADGGVRSDGLVGAGEELEPRRALHLSDANKGERLVSSPSFPKLTGER